MSALGRFVAIALLASAAGFSGTPTVAPFFRVTLSGAWQYQVDARNPSGDCYLGPVGAERFCGILIVRADYAPNAHPFSRTDMLEYIDGRWTTYRILPANSDREAMRWYPQKRGEVLDLVTIDKRSGRRVWTRLVVSGFHLWHFEYSAQSTGVDSQSVRAYSVLNSARPKTWNGG